MGTDYYTDANEQRRIEHLSPSGRYRLVIRSYGTKPGCWNYSRGTVYRTFDGSEIGDVKRNYSSFDFEFVEGHPNGHDYLVFGEDYQGQTVIELDTGKRRNNLPEEAKKGHAFCWVETEFNRDAQVLIVSGCHWACPYEYRIYDFADPMAGWPEIEAPKFIDCGHRKPEIAGPTVICFETHREYIPLGVREYDDDAMEGVSDEDQENEVNWRVITDVVTEYRREGLKLVLVSERVSDQEKQHRIEQEAARKKYEAWVADIKANDPLYLKYVELVKAPWLSPEDHEGRGVTFDGWGGEWKGKEARWCRRIVKKSDDQPWTIDFEWAVQSGPVKLQIFKDGKTHSDKFFPHSAEGVEQAFSYARELVEGRA